MNLADSGDGGTADPAGIEPRYPVCKSCAGGTAAAGRELSLDDTEAIFITIPVSEFLSFF